MNSSRRAVAFCSAAVFLAGVAILSARPTPSAGILGVWLIGLGVLSPIAFFVGHLNFTRELSEQEKDVWRRFTWPGFDFWIRIYRYLKAQNLRAATAERERWG